MTTQMFNEIVDDDWDDEDEAVEAEAVAEAETVVVPEPTPFIVVDADPDPDVPTPTTAPATTSAAITTSLAPVSTTDPIAAFIPDPARIRDTEGDGDWGDLSDEHVEYLRARAVAPLVAYLRGVTTASAGDLPNEWVGSWVDRYLGEDLDVIGAVERTAMVIPLYGVNHDSVPSLHQLKCTPAPEVPDKETGKKKPLKFVLPKGSQRGLALDQIPADVHPEVIDEALAGVWPLVFTEGQAKGDSILTAAWREGLSVVPVTFTGVTMPYVTDVATDGAKTRRLSPALEGVIPLEDRTVFLAWDADWRTNRDVKNALVQTGKLLAAKGCDVRIVDTPAVNGDEKAGVDDVLADAAVAGVQYPLAALLAAAIPFADVLAEMPTGPVREFDMLDPERAVPELLRALGWMETDSDNTPGEWAHPAGPADRVARTVTAGGVTEARFEYRADDLFWGGKALDIDTAIQILCGGRISGTTAIVQWVRSADVENGAIHRLLEQCRGDARAFRRLAEDEKRQATSRSGEVEPAGTTTLIRAASLEAALEDAVFTTDGPGQTVQISDELQAVVGGPGHGLWTMIEDTDFNGRKVVHRIRVTDWLAWRTAATVELDGSGQQVGEPTFTVTVLDRHGRQTTVAGLGEEASLTARTIWSKSDAGIALPSSRDRVGCVDNMLSMLGRYERQTIRVWRRAGWTTVDGNTVLLGMAGSVDAAGVRTDVLAAPPQHMGKTLDLPTARHVGWTRTSETDDERAEALGAVQAFIDICPGHPEVGIALLGMAGAAPLMASERGAILLEGRSDHGKSFLQRLLQCFWTDELTDVLIGLEKSTKAGTQVWGSWCGALPVLFDDYRHLDGDQRGNATRDERFTGLVQATYAEGGGAKIVERSGTFTAPGIGSGEVVPEDLAAGNRTLTVSINPSVLPIVGDIGSDTRLPIDVFKEDFAITGLANRAGADLMRHWAGRIDEKGLPSLTAWSNRHSKEHFLSTFGEARAGQIAGYVRLGWDAWYSYAREHGLTDMLPAEDEVDSALTKLVRGSRAQAAQADQGSKILAALGDLVQLGRGHLLNAEMRTPDSAHCVVSGWESHAVRDGHEWRPRGDRLGFWSKDYQRVLIPHGSVAAAIKARGLTISDHAARRAMEAACIPRLSTPPGGALPTRSVAAELGMTSRIRGWVLPASALGFDCGEDDRPAATNTDMVTGPAFDDESVSYAAEDFDD